eukprot:1566436-Amphidinium_carterae.1
MRPNIGEMFRQQDLEAAAAAEAQAKLCGDDVPMGGLRKSASVLASVLLWFSAHNQPLHFDYI